MQNYTRLMYEVLEKENEQRKPSGHYPSSASFKLANGELIGSDLLTQYLKWNEVPYSNPAMGADLFKMRLGDSAHYTIAFLLKKCPTLKVLSEKDAAFVVGSSKQVPGLRYPVNYRVDCLVNDGKELGLVEVKSTMQQAMYGSGFGIKYTGPKLDHILQVICYLELNPIVKYASILYVDRGTGGMLQFDLTKRPDGFYNIDGKPLAELNWTGIVNRWKELETHLSTRTPPKIERSVWLNEKTGEIQDVKQIKGERFKTDWQWVYSPYRDYVWKNPENMKYTYNSIHGITA